MSCHRSVFSFSSSHTFRERCFACSWKISEPGVLKAGDFNLEQQFDDLHNFLHFRSLSTPICFANFSIEQATHIRITNTCELMGPLSWWVLRFHYVGKLLVEWENVAHLPKSRMHFQLWWTKTLKLQQTLNYRPFKEQQLAKILIFTNIIIKRRYFYYLPIFLIPSKRMYDIFHHAIILKVV